MLINNLGGSTLLILETLKTLAISSYTVTYVLFNDNSQEDSGSCKCLQPNEYRLYR